MSTGILPVKRNENHYDTICSFILCPHQVPWETRDDLVPEGDVDVAAVDLVEVAHAYPGEFQGFLWLQRALQQGKSKRNVLLSFSAKHGSRLALVRVSPSFKRSRTFLTW